MIRKKIQNFFRFISKPNLGLRYILVLGVVALVVGFFQADSKGLNIIELRDSGFYPSRLIIKQGDVVTFTTNRGKPFWPASNVHPTHELYSDFDPKKPLSADQSWSFRFNLGGTWPYHDHLVPGYSGVIVVEGNASSNSLDCSNLYDLDKSRREQCWEQTINMALEEGGLNSAFKAIKTLYQTDKMFIMDGCHLHAHKLGEAAYGQYLKDENLDQFDLTADSVACGYGFYHGFLEHLFRDNPDISGGRELCQYLINRLSSDVPGIRLNCYHALGHGFIEDPPPPKASGDPQAMIDPALDRCDQLLAFETQEVVNECLQGAFNVLGDWIAIGKYDILAPENSMWLCPNQRTHEYQIACYYELAMRIRDLHNLGVAKVYDMYVKSMDDSSAAEVVVNNVAASVIERAMDKDSYVEFIEDCKRLPKNLVDQCVRGTIGGIMAQAEPGLEYVKALKTCVEADLTDKLKHSCFEHLSERLRRFYAPAKVAEICLSFPAVYQNFCKAN